MMTKRKRIQAVLNGEDVDRVPVSFWRHWPGDDQNPDTLAMVTLDFQHCYDLDFIKLPMSPAYTVSDYGVKHEYQGNLIGDRIFTEYTVKTVKDWDLIEPLNVSAGAYGWNLDALRIVLKRKDPETPVIVTMFNPLAIAAYLAGDNVFLAHLRSHPERVESALKAITETSKRFAREVINEGCDGIFLSTKFASYEIMNEQEYLRFGRPADLEVLKAAAGGWFNVLHLHGQYPMLSQVADYPVGALNWHDRTTSFNLTQAAKLFSGALMGGVEQYKCLRFGTSKEIKNQVYDAVGQMNGHRIIVTPGCTYPIDVPHYNLMAMREAIEVNNISLEK